jgi:hypothetical protein
MRTSLRGPIAALVLSLVVLLVALVLDRGSAQSRDAALLVGSPALYALIPASVVWLVVVWLVVAPARRWRRGHSA